MGLCVMAIDDARTENAEGLRNSLHLVGVGMPQRQFFHEVQPGLSLLSCCLKPYPKVMQATHSLCSYFSDFALRS